jgi:hypothetical protein
MPADHSPSLVHQVMVSSTYIDLEEHRAALILALHKNKLYARVMEHDDARAAGDVIDSSLAMVRDSSAYILLVGHRYGQAPADESRNPDGLSITELEFNEAVRLGRPTLLFVMGDDHPVKARDTHGLEKKVRRLAGFRKRAKLASPCGKVNRVYATFNSVQEFKDKIGPSLADLCRVLDANVPPAAAASQVTVPADTDAIPVPEREALLRLDSLRKIGIIGWEESMSKGTTTAEYIRRSQMSVSFLGIAASKWLTDPAKLMDMMIRHSSRGGRAEFLLLDPNSDACGAFERRKQMAQGSLRQQIYEGTRAIYKLAGKVHNVFVRYYSQEPRFRIVIIDDKELIVGLYSYTSTSWDDTPQLILDHGQQDWSFYYGFRAMFQSMWTGALPASES